MINQFLLLAVQRGLLNAGRIPESTAVLSVMAVLAQDLERTAMLILAAMRGDGLLDEEKDESGMIHLTPTNKLREIVRLNNEIAGIRPEPTEEDRKAVEEFLRDL